MKGFVVLVALTAFSPSADAALVVGLSGDSNGSNFATDPWFSVSANAGDMIVVAHSNNKRANGQNLVSATATGGLAFSSQDGGQLSGNNMGAYVFWAPVTTAGSFDVTLGTSNTTTTVSHATTWWVLESSTGPITVAEQGGGINAGDGTSDVFADADFSTLDSGLVFGAGAASAGTLSVAEPGTLTRINNSGGSTREIYTGDLAGYAAGSSAFSIGSNAGGVTAAMVGFKTVAVPEPSSLALLACGGLLGVARRRRR